MYWKQLKPHPLAEAFPMLGDAELIELGADIAANGLHVPVVVHEGFVLDGRNRLAACVRVDVEPSFVEYGGKDARAFVLSMNVHRRHLTADQRTEGVRKLYPPAPHGGDRKGSSRSDYDLIAPQERPTKTREEVAQAAGVSTATVDKYDRLQREHAAGNVTDAERQAVSDGEKSSATVLAEAKDRRARERLAKRQAVVAEVNSTAEALAWPEGKWSVVYADPPWDMGDSRAMGPNRGGPNDPAVYPTMDNDAIKALDVPGICNDPALLALWIPASRIKLGFETLDAWGFEYKSHLVWHKQGDPNNFTARFVKWNHEVLLVGTRGDWPYPEVGASSVVVAPRRKHSEKPDAVRAIVEEWADDMPKVELFARRPASGWDLWGAEAPK